MKPHHHGVLTKPTIEPLDGGCPMCVFYADAEREHRESGNFLLEAWLCLGCSGFIMAETSPVGTALTGHPFKNELCESSWDAACDAADGKIPPVRGEWCDHD